MIRSLVLILSIFSGWSACARLKFSRRHFNEIFRLQVPMMAAYDRVKDGRSVEGFPGYPLVRDLSFYKIAKRNGLIFKNSDPAELPAGEYHFVIFLTGGVTFGKDDGHAMIGTLPFELAQGHDVLAAGQYDDGRFNLQSSYVDNYNENFKGFREHLAKSVSEFFNAYSTRPMHYVEEHLFPRNRRLTTEAIKRYCRYPEFWSLHRETLCRGFKSLSCADDLVRFTPPTPASGN